MARPSIRPPPGWVNSKPWPLARSLGTMNRLRPRCVRVRSGSVRASSISTSARPANVHQVLTPLITQPASPSGPVAGVAITLMLATSEPKSGSVTATAAMISPVARRGSQASFWASVPPVSSARARISGRVMSEPPAPSEPRDSSSVAMTMPR